MPRKITGVDPKIVDRYAELIRDGYQGFPPIEIWQKVWQDGRREWWIVSGIHRYKAALAAGKESFPCEIRKFPEKKFLLRAYSANLKHGVRYKSAENRLVVQQCYQEGLTVAEISEGTGIPQRTLRRWLKPLADKKREDLKVKVWQMREAGESIRSISEKLGIAKTTAGRMVSHFGQMAELGHQELSEEYLTQIDIPSHVSEEIENGDEGPVADTGVFPNSAEQTSIEPSGNIQGVSDSRTNDKKAGQRLDKSSLINKISTNLDSLIAYNELPPEKKDVIKVIVLANLCRLDTADLLDVIGEGSLSTIKKIMMAAISLALLEDYDSEDVANVANTLKIDLKACEVIQQFLPYRKMLCPTGPHMEQWVQQNLSREDMDLIARLAGVNKSELSCRIKGKKPPRAAHYKKPPTNELNRMNDDVYVLRIIRDYLKDPPYDDEVLANIQICFNKVAITMNEIHDALHQAIRASSEKVRQYKKNGSQTALDQFAGIVKNAVWKNQHRLPGIAKKDLEAECWMRIVETRATWDPSRGEINSWMRQNVKWEVMNLCKKEYKRKEKISRYKADAEVLGQDRKDMHY